MFAKSNSICVKPPKITKDISKKNKQSIHKINELYNSCTTYEKCSKLKCNNADIKLKTELAKLPFTKVMNITQNCMKEKDIKQCSLNNYSKLSTALKKITSDIQNCKDNVCKNEHDNMMNISMKLIKPMKGKINKMFKTIKKNKVVMKTASKLWKKKHLTKKRK